MALNYAETYSPELLEILMQGALTSPFVGWMLRHSTLLR